MAVEIYFVTISNLPLPESVFSALTEKTQGFQLKSSKVSLLAHLFTRVLLCRKTGLKNEQLHFAVGEHGKPYLCNDISLQFNLSHKENAFVLAIAEEAVGIDLEEKRTISPKVAARFFSEDEKAIVFDSEDKEKAFFEIWTKKEACLKCEGAGLTLALVACSVLQEPIASRLKTFEKGNYLISFCTPSGDPDYSLTCLDETAVMQCIQELL